MPERIKVAGRGSPLASARLRARIYSRDRRDPEASRFYDSAAWRGVRALAMRSMPLCVDCLKRGRHTPTQHVHHLVERSERPDLALDLSNLVGLCHPCHTRRHNQANRNG